MNASPANLNSANPVQTQSAAGKPQESASDTPFSQVLSSEIAQNRRGGETRKNDKTNPGAENEIAQSQHGKEPGKDDKTHPGTKDVSETGDLVDEGAIPAVKADNIQIAAAFDMLRADAISASPEPFLALAIPSSQAQSESLQLDDAAPESPVARRADIQIGRDPKKGSSAKALQTAQLGNTAAGSQKPDSGQAAKNDAGFIGQLAAARQSDSVKTAEPLSDLMSNSLMRAAPQASVEAPTPLSGASASRLAPSIGTAAWGQALGEKIVWMAAGAQQTASLTLNPPNMGPLQIVLNISNEQATASFFSAQPEVRQALEAAFPRLREMMNEAGIQLGQATVSADTPQQNAPDQRSQRAALPFPNLDEASAGGLPLSQVPGLKTGRGLIDTFA